MALFNWLGTKLPALMRPLLLLSLASYHFFITVFEVIFVEQSLGQLFNLTKLRYKAFARLWTRNGEAMSQEMPGPLDALLQKCSGVVLDIGPGSGEILPRFNASKIHTMYGAEPAVDLHPGLLRNAQKAGFGGKFHALLCGGEPESLIPALHKSGVLGRSGTRGTAENGVFDDICCVRVLCGVPHPKETIKGLYELLKPGGRMVICEHVVNPWRSEGSILARLAQFVYTAMGWPFFMGGCELQRRTPEYLREAAGKEGWAQFQLEYVDPKVAVPFVIGELRKRG
ncbi:uncharacterized protein BDR25DRAFT_303693 [Lindgomyces ingoldianus]|uniref:Uncharacterized protein n=1 Tax=Lindgomyces ingoldianus TaxID=673940 RepID=A0ACB6QUG3_9PLEO|nr:uncharacterized protein BDR25DRAFT_303693 [Lindgomyces ingoldianus]KAF2470643.1 hypothetical protein BDR25DRAFT_303693 [Lindgomyces ingoldianus]